MVRGCTAATMSDLRMTYMLPQSTTVRIELRRRPYCDSRGFRGSRLVRAAPRVTCKTRSVSNSAGPADTLRPGSR
jgi:hypothetical protein